MSHSTSREMQYFLTYGEYAINRVLKPPLYFSNVKVVPIGCKIILGVAVAAFKGPNGQYIHECRDKNFSEDQKIPALISAIPVPVLPITQDMISPIKIAMTNDTALPLIVLP